MKPTNLPAVLPAVHHGGGGLLLQQLPAAALAAAHPGGHGLPGHRFLFRGGVGGPGQQEGLRPVLSGLCRERCPGPEPTDCGMFGFT